MNDVNTKHKENKIHCQILVPFDRKYLTVIMSEKLLKQKQQQSLSSSSSKIIQFDNEKHILYFIQLLKQISNIYTKLDTNRLTIVHFAIHSLDMLGIFNNYSIDELQQKYNINKISIIEWIYSLQTTTNDVILCQECTTGSDNVNNNNNWIKVGFKGGGFLGTPVPTEYNYGHVAMTYTALATLCTLGSDDDDITVVFDRIDRIGILRAISLLQLRRKQQNETEIIDNEYNNNNIGSFQCIGSGSEYDMRFVYCVCCICYILNDFTTINIPDIIQFICNCHTFDGSFALVPGQEGHGGSTFCAIASLVLLNQLHIVLPINNSNDKTSTTTSIDNNGSSSTGTSSSNRKYWRDNLIQWCCSRQVQNSGGIQGRPSKLEDTCYSYWIGGTLYMLGYTTINNTCTNTETSNNNNNNSTINEFTLLDHTQIVSFVLQCQNNKYGGFSKVIGIPSDALHSFYSIAYINLAQNFIGTNNDSNDTDTDNNNNNNNNYNNKHNNVDYSSIKLKPFNCTLGICQDRVETLPAYKHHPIP